MGGLTFVDLNSESDYISLFCKEYGNAISTEDGFIVECKYPLATAKHICHGGKKNAPFQKARAQRILWPKYILSNPVERKVLIDNQTGYIIFFFEKGKTAYAVVCSKLKNGNLNLTTGFLVDGKRAMAYRKGKQPYSFYPNKK